MSKKEGEEFPSGGRVGPPIEGVRKKESQVASDAKKQARGFRWGRDLQFEVPVE